MSELICLENISKNYVLGKVVIPALRGINLTIRRNEYVALMGASGSGKSTLMNVIGLLDTATEGKYYLNDRDVSRLSDNERAAIRNKEIGFVFQTFNLMPRLSALENVALPLVYAGWSRSKREERARELMEAVGLAGRMHHRPNELSGGQKQRVALARALANHPSLILADEPTGNLDTQTSDEIMQLFDHIHRQGNTIVLVTHEADISQHAQRIIRLRDGQVLDDQPNPASVLTGASV
ncbi:MAG: ABC transporter ATP-binding protein [Chitinophagales bacterium]|nr:ABC transporter ATP-binding protein [Chitinophagales bacterium]